MLVFGGCILHSNFHVSDLGDLRSPPPGVDEIAAIAKAITETEGRGF